MSQAASSGGKGLKAGHNVLETIIIFIDFIGCSANLKTK
jgi:hypothetical protein